MKSGRLVMPQVMRRYMMILVRGALLVMLGYLFRTAAVCILWVVVVVSKVLSTLVRRLMLTRRLVGGIRVKVVWLLL